MPRKFRLGVHRKNQERKQKALKEANDCSGSETVTAFSVDESAPVPNLSSLKEEILNAVPQNWKDVSHATDDVCGPQLCLAQVEMKEGHPTVIKSICVCEDFSWVLQVYQNTILPEALNITLPSFINSVSALKTVCTFVDSCNICCGNQDEKFHLLSDVRKGKFMDTSGKTVVAYKDIQSLPTIRCMKCLWLTPKSTSRCSECVKFRRTLHGMLHRSKRLPSLDSLQTISRVNHRYLKSPEKLMRLNELSKKLRESQSKVYQLKSKLAKLSDNRGVVVDDALHKDLSTIMEENNASISGQYSTESFQRIFWEQQIKASKLKACSSMKWDPLLIRWCLYLRHLSSGAYEMIRESGVISLPSQRTLRDYTYYTTAATGFSDDVDKQLMMVAKLSTCPEREKYVVILIDEMHIRANLVYNKHSGALIGFTNLGDINQHLVNFEQSLGKQLQLEPLANSMLVMMVRGLFSNLEFPYAQFPCTQLSGDQLYDPFWEAVRRLELCGFYVLALICDGLAANRRFFSLHNPQASPVDMYKVPNPYSSDNRFLYFLSPGKVFWAATTKRKS